MALITCPECGNKVSTLADVCPHCGFPIKSQLASDPVFAEYVEKQKPATDLVNLLSAVAKQKDEEGDYLGLGPMRILGYAAWLEVKNHSLDFRCPIYGGEDVRFDGIRAYGFKRQEGKGYGRFILFTDKSKYSILFEGNQEEGFRRVYEALKARYPQRETDGEADIPMPGSMSKTNNPSLNARVSQSISSSPKKQKKGANQDPGPIRCPKCGSTQLTANKKGFGVGKAVVGIATIGAIGAVAGNIGAKKVCLTCMNCGHSWIAGKRK